MSILKEKQENGEEIGLSWEDTKNMPITSRVIQETLRVASILSFTFREATEDVEYQGYLIPKGWKVLPLFRNIHHSPENFKEPEKFDPSRFEVIIVTELVHSQIPAFFFCLCSLLFKVHTLIDSVNNFGRLLQNLILSCHLEMGSMHVLAMN